MASQQAVASELQGRLSHREREIDMLTDKTYEEKQLAKRELYLQTLEAMAAKDKGFSSLLVKLKQGLQATCTISNPTPIATPDITTKPAKKVTEIPQSSNGVNEGDLQKKVGNYERVMKEMKK